jgi:hypothetical protein
MHRTQDSTMPRPTHLVKPPLAAFQFINHVLHGTWTPGGKKVILFVDYDGDIFADNDNKYTKNNFQHARQVTSGFIAPLAAMTDATFEGLVGRFGYQFHGMSIDTKDSLAYAASTAEPEAPDISQEQLQTYILYHLKDEIKVNWHDVVDLYNESAPDQQEAICQFFTRILNRSLEDLLAIPGPEPLPANLFPPLATHIVDGKPCTYNELTDSFVDDQEMILNYRVVGFRGESRNDIQYLIASTMSLEEAIAMATRYTQNITEKDTLEQITIHHGGVEVAKSNILSARPIPEGTYYRSLPARLRWNYDPSAQPAISEDRFNQAVMAAEKAMGVKWSKGIMLEDALGM